MHAHIKEFVFWSLAMTALVITIVAHSLKKRSWEELSFAVFAFLIFLSLR